MVKFHLKKLIDKEYTRGKIIRKNTTAKQGRRNQICKNLFFLSDKNFNNSFFLYIKSFYGPREKLLAHLHFICDFL